VVLLRELLDLEVLRRGEARVLVGDDRLEQEIGWVHVGEIVDIAQYLSGGEVLLTAATGLAERRGNRRRYVRELADVGVLALIVELGRGFSEVPQEMVAEAEERGLVLVELQHEVPFVAVTQAAHTAIINEHHRILTRATEIGDAVGQLLLDGASLAGMLERLAELLGNPVVLEDEARHVVAFGRASTQMPPLLRAWQAHSRRGHASQGRAASVQEADSEPPCAWCMVALRGETWGRLHVLAVDAPIDTLTKLALGRAASSVALHLLADRDASLNQAAQHSLIQDLTRESSFSGEDFAARASGLGVDLDGGLVLLVIGADPGTADAEVDAVRAAMRDAGWPGVLGSVDDQVVVVAAAHPPQGLISATEDLAGRLSDAGLPLHVAVSRPTRTALLPRAYTEARTALAVGPRTGDGRVHRYDDLVLHRLLAPLLQGPELANFVEGELGELIAYDAEHRAKLLHTLDAYLQHNGSKAATAEALHLQRRSVYYRLERIEKLLGRTIDSPSERVRLYVALRARELLEARPLQGAA
jgi:purine catabolism regulator